METLPEILVLDSSLVSRRESRTRWCIFACFVTQAMIFFGSSWFLGRRNREVLSNPNLDLMVVTSFTVVLKEWILWQRSCCFGKEFRDLTRLSKNKLKKCKEKNNLQDKAWKEWLIFYSVSSLLINFRSFFLASWSPLEMKPRLEIMISKVVDEIALLYSVVLEGLHKYLNYNHHILCWSFWWRLLIPLTPLPKIVYDDVILGLLLILSFSISASLSLFSFALRFWNQIFTWVSVRFNDEENSALSAMERYCLDLNFLSNARSCWVVNGVLGFLLLLCLRRVHLMFGSLWCWWCWGSSAPFCEE